MDGIPPASELGITTKDMGISNDRLQVASNLIIPHDSNRLDALHSEWTDRSKPIELDYSSGEQRVKAIGTSHERNPDSAMVQEVVRQTESYLNSIPADQQIIMVEGFPRGVNRTWNSLQDAVADAGEMGAAAFAAQYKGAEVVSPEPPREATVRILRAAGVPSEQIALFYTLRALPAVSRRAGGNTELLAGVFIRDVS